VGIHSRLVFALKRPITPECVRVVSVKDVNSCVRQIEEENKCSSCKQGKCFYKIYGG
jgi:hypothetical protein